MATFVAQPNLIFIHIPKNGGTSISKYLRLHANGIKGSIVHSNTSHIELEFKEAVNFPICAVIRNPWDRLVSAYHFLKVKQNVSLTFEQWLYKTPSKGNNWFTHFTNQSQWIPKDPDYLLRFENLKFDFEKIKKYLNCNVDLPITNSSNRTHYRNYYNAQTINYVGDIFYKDIKRWNYDY